MASDFYTFEGNVGPYEVEVDFCDTDQPDADRACVRRVNGELNAHDFYTVARLDGHATAQETNAEYDRRLQLEEEIRELIRKGQFNLKYTGGWCPSGYVWGPEKTCPKYD